MIVAALGAGNDAVGVTDAVDDMQRRRSLTVSVTTTVSVPFPSAATITASHTITATHTTTVAM